MKKQLSNYSNRNVSKVPNFVWIILHIPILLILMGIVKAFEQFGFVSGILCVLFPTCNFYSVMLLFGEPLPIIDADFSAGYSVGINLCYLILFILWPYYQNIKFGEDENSNKLSWSRGIFAGYFHWWSTIFLYQKNKSYTEKKSKAYRRDYIIVLVILCFLFTPTFVAKKYNKNFISNEELIGIEVAFSACRADRWITGRGNKFEGPTYKESKTIQYECSVNNYTIHRVKAVLVEQTYLPEGKTKSFWLYDYYCGKNKKRYTRCYPGETGKFTSEEKTCYDDRLREELLNAQHEDFKYKILKAIGSSGMRHMPTGQVMKVEKPG